MAKMIPQNVAQFTTEGERQTYRFLEAVAKPDANFLCWYLPDVQGQEPDFILYSRKCGMIILEVRLEPESDPGGQSPVLYARHRWKDRRA